MQHNRKINYTCLFASFTLLFTLFFQWNIIELLTPYVAGPLIAVSGLLMILCTLWSAIFAFRNRIQGFKACVPLAITVIALAIANFVPLSGLWLKANFNLKKDTREQVIAKVITGEFTPNINGEPETIHLPETYPVSMSGNDIIVRGEPSQPFVFFFTFRGPMNSYSGFLWVPEDKTPEQFSETVSDSAKTTIKPFDGQWYYIAHR